MMLSRKALAPLLLVLALGLALAVAFGAKKYISAKADAAAAQKLRTASVVVVARDMAAGDELGLKDLAILQWPYADRPPGTFSEAKGLVGRVLHKPMVKAEPVMESKLAPNGMAAGMAAAVRRGMRAVTVSASDVVGVAGYLKPGDRVDVIVTLTESQYKNDPAAHVVLQDIEVLSVLKNQKQTEGKKKGSASKNQVVTLMMEPGEVERLALGTTEGEILLALRNRADHTMAVTKGVEISSLFPSLAPPEPPPAAAAAAPSPPPSDKVEVIKGMARSSQELTL